jgi:hypothetical protein
MTYQQLLLSLILLEQVFYVGIYSRTVRMIDSSTDITFSVFDAASANVCDALF